MVTACRTRGLERSRVDVAAETVDRDAFGLRQILGALHLGVPLLRRQRVDVDQNQHRPALDGLSKLGR